MNRTTKYVIEKRRPSGEPDFSSPHPEATFGVKAITGITADEMGDIILRLFPDAILDGRYVATWPTFVNPDFRARVKTW